MPYTNSFSFFPSPYGSVSREALTGRRASEAQLTNQQHPDLQGPYVFSVYQSKHSLNFEQDFES